MQRAFRKISRVASFGGGTKWYLSEDCLLAAKRMMYAVEYRRFYLRDLESIVVWPSRAWIWRPIIPGALLGISAGALWHWVNFTSGVIVGSVGLAWVTLELALGPTARARIRTTGATIDLPLVKRARRARKVLEKIDAAVRVARGDMSEGRAVDISGSQPAQPSAPSSSKTVPAGTPVEDLT